MTQRTGVTSASLPKMVSREEWMTARLELPTQGKELTRARDRVNTKRRRLLMIRVEKDYGYRIGSTDRSGGLSSWATSDRGLHNCFAPGGGRAVWSGYELIDEMDAWRRS
jgi:hypothetical protein